LEDEFLAVELQAAKVALLLEQVAAAEAPEER